MNLALILSLLSAGPQADEEKIKAVTTLQVYRHVAEKVGGDRVEAVGLAHPRRDPHYLIPDPLMQRKASDADLFIETGRSFEPWAVNVVRHSGNPGIQAGDRHVYASKGCSVEELPKFVSREWGDIHPEGNPHVWLDPLNLKRIAKNIGATLGKIDPDGKEAYRKNLKAFEREIDEAMFGRELVGLEGGSLLWRKERLGKLDAYLKEEGLEDKLGGWAKKARKLRGAKLVSYHKTYVYFAKRFGFEIVGELEEKPGIEPSPRQRDAIVKLVKREGVRVILNDIFYPSQAAAFVADQTEAKVVTVPIDVGAEEGTESYVAMIDLILDRMLGAMQ